MFDKQNQDQDEQEMIYEETEEVSSDEDSADLDVAKEKINKLKEKLKKCQEEKQEYLTGWQREKADFINYKRRQESQMGEWVKMAPEPIIKDILVVFDSLHAWNNAGKEAELWKDDWPKDLKVIEEQLLRVLKEYGLEEIKTIGEKFNPEFHEAVEQVESSKEDGIIIEEIQKGYLLNGKVLRTAKVKVSKK